MHITRFVVLLLLAFSISLQAASKPNIVYIMCDELGYYEPSFMGGQTIRTPRIDRLAAEGVWFTQALAGSSVCAPTRCVLMTGKHSGHAVVRANWENGGWGEDEPEGQYPLPEVKISK